MPCFVPDLECTTSSLAPQEMKSSKLEFRYQGHKSLSDCLFNYSNENTDSWCFCHLQGTNSDKKKKQNYKWFVVLKKKGYYQSHRTLSVITQWKVTDFLWLSQTISVLASSPLVYVSNNPPEFKFQENLTTLSVHSIKNLEVFSVVLN